MTATVVRRFTYGEGAGKVYLPGDPFEPSGAHSEKALWNREYLRAGYVAPPPTFTDWGYEAWSDDYQPLVAVSSPVESSRPHNRKKKVA